MEEDYGLDVVGSNSAGSETGAVEHVAEMNVAEDTDVVGSWERADGGGIVVIVMAAFAGAGSVGAAGAAAAALVAEHAEIAHGAELGSEAEEVQHGAEIRSASNGKDHPHRTRDRPAARVGIAVVVAIVVEAAMCGATGPVAMFHAAVQIEHRHGHAVQSRPRGLRA